MEITGNEIFVFFFIIWLIISAAIFSGLINLFKIFSKYKLLAFVVAILFPVILLIIIAPDLIFVLIYAMLPGKGPG